MRMPRALGLTVILVAVGAALAAGSAFAFNSSDGDVARNSHARPRPQEQEDSDDAQEQADDDATDAAAGNAGGVDKAALIAEEFGVSPDAVAALHADGIGWGALFKLYTYARVMGVSVDDLAAAAPIDADGERDYAFGELKKSLTDEQLAALSDGPKNFGQLVSKSKKPAHAGPP